MKNQKTKTILKKKGERDRQHKTYPKSSVIFSMILLSLFSFSLVSSAPPFIQESDPSNNLLLITEIPSTHQLGEDYYLHTHVYNSTNNLIITSGISCYYHFYNHQINGGQHISIGNLTQYGQGYETIVNGSLINESGEYSALIWCNTTDTGGVKSYRFEVNPTGSVGSSTFFLILILSIAAIFLIASLITPEEFFVYISGILFLLSGIYIIINGVDILNNEWTRMISFVLIGIGILFTIGAYILNIYSNEED